MTAHPTNFAGLAAQVSSLPFVAAHGIEIIAMEPGRSTAAMDFDERFATPPDLFPASMVGMLGDVAAISACMAAVAPASCATLDFTVKMTAQARGSRLEAEGVALQAGSTIAVGRADVFAIAPSGERVLCATVLATGRVIRGKS
ncbi:PaaI family thioesterase [Mesorhizobium sp. Z1-4]|uniref:PaaI family thioesterase n=1 Tax=Mesorhizobium sp. Z1-4 TaxID=2448478 RepID=UPI000FDA9F10|nr:PaaI family thioesterase [Mesorhizobium sp. Z1-4]